MKMKTVEIISFPNRCGEYGLIITFDGEVVDQIDGLSYEQAVMEKKMLDGEEVSFEEYHEAMSSF